MSDYYKRKPIKIGSMLLDKDESQKTEPNFLESNEVVKEAGSPFLYQREKDTCSLPLTKQRMLEGEQDKPMMYHVTGIGRGIRKWFKGLSVPTRVVLAILALYILSLLVNILVQLFIQSLGLIYTILGIIASVIVIYEFFIKKQP